MKVYICSIVDTEGFGGCKESEILIDTDRNKLIEKAFISFKAEMKYMKEEGTYEDNEIFEDLPETIEEFEKELTPQGCVLLQRYDSHRQYEYFEREV